MHYTIGTTNLDAKDVVAGSVGSVERLALDVVAPPTVVGSVGTKVEGAGSDVVSALAVGVVVSAGLHNVDLTRAGPLAVHIVFGQHPDCRPQPVTGRELSLDLDTSVFDGGTKLGVDATRLDRVDNCTVGGVGGYNTVRPLGASATLATEVKHVVIVDQAVVLQSGLDDENAILDEDIFVSVGGLIELTVAEEFVSLEDMTLPVSNLPVATDFDLLGPDVTVPRREVVSVNRAVLVDCDTANAIPDEDTSDDETEDKTCDRDDSDPLLSWILPVKPRLLDLTLLHSSGAEVVSVVRTAIARAGTVSRS